MTALRPGWAVKAIVVVIFMSMLFRCVSASAFAFASATSTNHSVGGASGWDLSSNLQAWANRTTFFVGDSLVFRYTPVHDLLEVNKVDYDMCHTVDPMETHNDGETVIPLREAGNRYFICGRLGHCAMGLKLHVLVQVPAQHSTTAGTGSTNAPSPSPSGSPFTDSDGPWSETSPADQQVVGNAVPSPPPPAAASTNSSSNSTTTSASRTSDGNLIVERVRTWDQLLQPVVITLLCVLVLDSWDA